MDVKEFDWVVGDKWSGGGKVAVGIVVWLFQSFAAAAINLSSKRSSRSIATIEFFLKILFHVVKADDFTRFAT